MRKANYSAQSSLVKILLVVIVVFAQTLSTSFLTPANALPNVTATGTNPTVCNQTVGSTTGVSAVRLAGGDCVVKFTNAGASNTWTAPTNALRIRLLVLGGGGGGGVDAGSGGGGGGAYEATSVAVTPNTSYSLFVASGGTAGIYGGTSPSNGDTSTITIGVTTYGGTGGKPGPIGISTSPQTAAAVGGTGFGVGGTATNGATGGVGKGWVSGQTGAGAIGNDGNLTSDISGTSTIYGGSGAGGANVSGVSVAIVLGGAGGGGAAGFNSPTITIAGDGGANTGGGGGAGMSNASPSSYKSSGAGGSGVVILRYTPDTSAPTIISGATANFPENTPTSTNATTVTLSESSTVTLTGNTDGALFTLIKVDSVTVQIRFLTSPDYENPLDVGANRQYDIVIQAVDSAGNSANLSISITVTNVNESSILGSISTASPIYKGIATSISFTVNAAGNARFLVDGKRVASCLSVATTGSYPNFTATCNWKPTVGGRHLVIASFTPFDSSFSSGTTNASAVLVLKRTTTR